MPEQKWSIIVHGGARTISSEQQEPSRQAALAALVAGVAVLNKGGTALDAVEQSIISLENSDVFNAGKGSVKRANGEVEMDASIMDGQTLDIGAIAGLQDIENPIRVARKLLGEKPTFLAGQHAMEFALKQGFKKQESVLPDSNAASCDTVGCVAMDKDGNFAVGLSTGGLTGALPGRVGDVPLPGCGFYADNGRGALCLSGDGESIARVILAAEILRRLDHMEPQKAIEDALPLLDRVDGEAGCIVINKNGEIGWSHKSDHFTIAYQSSDAPEPVVSNKKADK